MTAHAWRLGTSSRGQSVRLGALGVAALGVLAAGVLAAVTHSPGADPPVLQRAAVAQAPAVPAPRASGAAELSPPAGFRAEDATAADTATSALIDRLRQDGSGPAVTQDVLDELGFERVRGRAWRDGRDGLVVVTYEFSDPRGARMFRDLAAASERADGASQALPLPGAPAARAVQLRGVDPPAQVAFLHDGDEAVVVGLVGPSAAPGGRLLEDLLTASPLPAGY